MDFSIWARRDINHAASSGFRPTTSGIVEDIALVETSAEVVIQLDPEIWFEK